VAKPAAMQGFYRKGERSALCALLAGGQVGGRIVAVLKGEHRSIRREAEEDATDRLVMRLPPLGLCEAVCMSRKRCSNGRSSKIAVAPAP
jgi:hypothetical protein